MQSHQGNIESSTFNDSVHGSASSTSFHSVYATNQSSFVPSSPSASSAVYNNAIAVQPLPSQYATAHKKWDALPFGGRAAIPDLNSSSSSGSVGHHLHLSIGDVADLLHPQYAIITGGRSRDGCALIQFPDHCNFQTLQDEDYTKLILYLTSVPSYVICFYMYFII